MDSEAQRRSEPRRLVTATWNGWPCRSQFIQVGWSWPAAPSYCLALAIPFLGPASRCVEHCVEPRGPAARCEDLVGSNALFCALLFRATAITASNLPFFPSVDPDTVLNHMRRRWGNAANRGGEREAEANDRAR